MSAALSLPRLPPWPRNTLGMVCTPGLCARTEEEVVRECHGCRQGILIARQSLWLLVGLPIWFVCPACWSHYQGRSQRDG